jgi:PTS system nitrogen regulatory IIA component
MHPTTVPKLQMTLADIFPPAAICLGLENRAKQSVIQELVRHLIDIGCVGVKSEAALVKAIMARETLGTTALGNGIAFPHCCSSVAERFVGVLALDKRGVAFGAVDGAPVFAIFLLIVPLEERAQQHEVLGKITAIGRDKSLRLQLRGCRTADAVHHLLQDLD